MSIRIEKIAHAFVLSMEELWREWVD